MEEAIHAARHALPLPSAPAARNAAAPGSSSTRGAFLDGASFPNEDARAFLDWSSRYDRATRAKSQTDAARLPDVVIPLLAHPALRKPGTLVLFGIDIVTPQMDELIGALSTQGCEVFKGAGDAVRSAVRRVEFTDSKSEIEAAAWWARARLESSSPAPRIGVVVPDLEAARARVRRTFAQVMNPSCLAETEAAVLPFNISLGAPLAEYPLAADALLVVDITTHEIAFEDRELRDPLAVHRGRRGGGARARLDAWLRSAAGRKFPRLALHHCAASMHRARRRSSSASSASRNSARRASSGRSSHRNGRRHSRRRWATRDPGERALDSAEHQALEKWHELLGEFASARARRGAHGVRSPRASGCASWRAAKCSSPEAGDADPVMGILESAGQSFDHLWVMGPTDEAWPCPRVPIPSFRCACSARRAFRSRTR